MLALAGSGVTLGLLSNIPAELADGFERRHAWLRRMASAGFSCRLGRAKPDPAVSAWSVRSLGRPAREILFVDDRALNVTAARAAGMGGHVFTGVGGLREALTGYP